MPTPAYVNESTDYGAYHVPEKPVGCNLEHKIVTFLRRESHHRDMLWSIYRPAGLGDFADGCLVVPSCLFKAAEVVSSKQHRRRPVHLIYI